MSPRGHCQESDRARVNLQFSKTLPGSGMLPCGPGVAEEWQKFAARGESADVLRTAVCEESPELPGLSLPSTPEAEKGLPCLLGWPGQQSEFRLQRENLSQLHKMSWELRAPRILKVML